MGPEMERKAAGVVRKSRGVQGMDTDARSGEMVDFLNVRDVIKMAVGQNDMLDLVFVRCERCRRHSRIHQDVPGEEAVSEIVAARDPLYRHAQ
jgi:hypothetical protein